MILCLLPFLTITRVSGATICMGIPNVCGTIKGIHYFTYLKAFQQTHKGFMQTAFSGSNPFNYRTHQHMMRFRDGRLPQKILQRIRPHTVRTLAVALLRSRILGMPGSQRAIVWRYWIRRYPSRRHFKVARFLSWGVRGRRLALHHLQKKIPRR